MRTNHKDTSFPFDGKDMVIKKGEFITSIKEGSQQTQMTPQQWRTAMGYLKSTSRITIKTTTKYSLISIQKWNEYQEDNKQDNKPVTNQQQTSNKPVTTDKNGNNVKNDKNINLKVNGEIHKDVLVDYILEAFRKLYDFNPTDRKPRFEAYNLIQRMRTFLIKRGKPTDEEYMRKAIQTYFNWIAEQNWAEGIQSLGTLRRKTNIFFAEIERSKPNVQN